MAIYAAMVKHVDEGVGRIIGELKKSGTFNNTIILFLSDNGACYEWGPFGFDKNSRAGITTLHKGKELETMGGPGTYTAYGSAWANLCNTPFRLYKHFTHQGGICSPFVVSWPEGVAAPGLCAALACAAQPPSIVEVLVYDMGWSTPISPPSGPAQWPFQGPPAESKFLAASFSPKAAG